MVNLLKKIFNIRKNSTESEDVLEISKIIGPQIDQVVSEVFGEFKEALLNEPITYIVPAVWGAVKKGSLSPVQQAMNHKIEPYVQNIFIALAFKHATPQQLFAIGFIVRGLIISKLTYMVEAMKNQILTAQEEDIYGLESLVPKGTA